MVALPHFVHIGLPKTASTWLQDFFAQHTEICFVYKPKFFQWDDCFSKGRDFYLSLFKPKTGNKISLDSDEQYSVGFRYRSFNWDCCYREKHPKDFVEAAQRFVMPFDRELIAKRIQQTAPDAKIMIVLRNQTDWLSSLYKHHVGKGESRRFREFIKEFLPAGFYASLAEMYFKLFGKENVLILFYEDLLANPVIFLDKVSRFFGISQFDYSQIDKKAKVSLTNRGAKIMQAINFAAKKFPKSAKPIFYLDKWIFSKLSDSELISKNDKEYLRNTYAEDNKKLAKFTDAKY